MLATTCGVLLLTALHHLHVSQATPLSQDQKRRIDSFVAKLMNCRQIPGLSLSIVGRDEVLYARGYGVADRERASPVTPDTLFPIGSTSKAFATTLLADALHNQTKFSWNTPVKKILGDDFQLYTKHLTEEVSLADVVAHRTGLSDVFLLFMAGYFPGTTTLDVLKKMKYVKPSYPLRTSMIYNNHLYTVAALALETLSGKPWEQLVQERLYNTIGMKSSGFIGRSNFQDVATSYTVYEGKIIKIEKELTEMVLPVGLAGGLLSTATDMAKWIQFHLNGGKTADKGQVMKNEALEETYQSFIPVPQLWQKRDLTRPTFPVDDVVLAYGLGWLRSVYRGYHKVWHSGSITTYKSQVWMFPDSGVGVFVAVNGPDTEEVSQAIISLSQLASDLALGEQPWLNATTACSFPFPWKNNTSPNESGEKPSQQSDPLPEAPSMYTRNYRHPAFGTIYIASMGDPPILTFKMGRFLQAKLLYNATSNRFRLATEDLWFWHKSSYEVWFDTPSILYVPLISKVDPPTAFIADGVAYNYLPEVNDQCSNIANKVNFMQTIYLSTLAFFLVFPQFLSLLNSF